MRSSKITVVTSVLVVLVTLSSLSCRNPLKTHLDDQKQKKAGSDPSNFPVDDKLPARQVFLNYELLRSSLASDEFVRIETIIDSLSKELERLSKDGNGVSQDSLSQIRATVPSFKTSKEEELRSAFGKLSEPIVELYKKSGSQALDIYHCPMARLYGYWLQPKGQSIANPYMGQRMVSCGSKVD